MTPYKHKIPRLPYDGSFLQRKVQEIGAFKIDGVYCRLIPLSRGYYAIVDAADFDRINKNKWSARCSKGTNFYAIRNTKNADGSHTTVSMHQEIMGIPNADHISTDGLDNRRNNLRPATINEQMRNRKRQRNNTTGFKGVSLNSRKDRYVARIQVNLAAIHLGTFSSGAEAHEAYKTAAVHYFGDFARFD
jgi:hypothetical protein